MPLYIVHADFGLTNRYHSGGAAIVEAVTKEQAIEKVAAARTTDNGKLWSEAYQDHEIPRLSAYHVQVWNGEVVIFPNAGCCGD